MTESCKCRCRLNILAFGFSLGLLWAVSLFSMGIITCSMTSGYGSSFVRALSTVYIGYHPGLVGSLIGAAWAFADAFIGGFLFAWIYNLCVGTHPCCCEKDDRVVTTQKE